MAEGNLDWLMEGLIQFLSSPIWKCNIDQFIDENCLIFDTADENKFTYTDVHNEYKTTVDNLLQKFFLQELNMTLAQLLSACSDGMATNTQNKELFQPLLAVDDFLLFKSIMVGNNVRLNKEAEKELRVLNQIEQYEYRNIEKSHFSSNGEGYPPREEEEQYSSPEPDEEKTLAQILLQSKLEYDRSVEEEEREFQKLIRAATEESLKCYEMEFKSSKLIEEQLATLALQDESNEQKEGQKNEEEEQTSSAVARETNDPPNYDDLIQPLNDDTSLSLQDTPHSNSNLKETSSDENSIIAVVPNSSTAAELQTETTTTATVNNSVQPILVNSTNTEVSDNTVIATNNTTPVIPNTATPVISNNPAVVPSNPTVISPVDSIVPKKRVSADESAASWLETARAETMEEESTLTQVGTTVQGETSHLQKREEYLKRRRDSILAKKKKERETQLKHFLNDNPQYSSSQQSSGSTTQSTSNNSSSLVLVNKTSTTELPIHKEEEEEKGKETKKSVKDKISWLKPKKKGTVLTPQVADKL